MSINKNHTPQAHATRREALELGAAYIERALEEMRGCARDGGCPGGSTEAAVMDAMHKGICAGRLRAEAEVEQVREKHDARR
jgi:hypothetical protein